MIFCCFRVHNKIKYDEDEPDEVMDANSFQIHLKSQDLIKNEISVWEKKPHLLNYLRQEVGHTLEVRQSDIDHHEAGDGVFVNTRDGRSLLPGTLIGFFPGVINGPIDKLPERSDEAI